MKKSDTQEGEDVVLRKSSKATKRPIERADSLKNGGANCSSVQLVTILYTWICLMFVILDGRKFDPRYKLAVKTFLMPVLALWVKVRLGKTSETPSIIYWGLLFATLGDIFLDLPAVLGKEGPWFLLGMAFFFMMQVSYIRGLIRMSSHNKGIPMVAMLAYVGAVLWVNINLGPNLGDLQVPTLIYSGSLASTAAITSAFGVKLGLGGLIFAISDFLILLELVGTDFPFRSMTVGATYVLAQYLIVSAWCTLIEKGESGTESTKQKIRED